MRHPEQAKHWHTNSNYVVCLSVKDETDLMSLSSKLDSKGIKHVTFREPDFGNQATSISIEPSDAARKACSNLPLMFKENTDRKPVSRPGILSYIFKNLKIQTR